MVGEKHKHDGHSDILDSKIFDRWDKEKVNYFLGNFSKLTPASASYNYTLTLSGILILGLGVAAAFMLLAQLEASSTKVNAASGGGYYKVNSWSISTRGLNKTALRS